MAHVMTTHDIGTVGQTTRMFIIGRAQQQGSGVDGTTGNNNQIGGILVKISVTLHEDGCYLASGSIRLEPLHLRTLEQSDIRILHSLVHANHLSVCFG